MNGTADQVGSCAGAVSRPGRDRAVWEHCGIPLAAPTQRPDRSGLHSSDWPGRVPRPEGPTAWLCPSVACQAGPRAPDVPSDASLLRHPLPGLRLRHRHRAGPSGPRRPSVADLHAYPRSGRPGRSQPAGARPRARRLLGTGGPSRPKTCDKGQAPQTIRLATIGRLCLRPQPSGLQA